MQTLYIVPEKVAMANRMDSSGREKQMDSLAFRKEKPEAVEVMALDQLTARTLSDPTMTEWEKAHALSDSLQKFMALKLQAFPELPPAVPSITDVPPPPPLPSVPAVPAASILLSNQLQHVKDFLQDCRLPRPQARSASVTPQKNIPPADPPNCIEHVPVDMDVQDPYAKDTRKRAVSNSPSCSQHSPGGVKPLLDVASGVVVVRSLGSIPSSTLLLTKLLKMVTSGCGFRGRPSNFRTDWTSVRIVLPDELQLQLLRCFSDNHPA
ncbi:hypothetical protein RvY_03043 [Ramazzottius varieornatus]|uniref:Uncharacterized protein n=1 Tax=Ramazzottius varieornatus TaxID=947166 RepID=A0A1D1UTT0_RAMVA|nr:hypothetical protein RvY_03043 [Ramazzottius varieornatus]